MAKEIKYLLPKDLQKESNRFFMEMQSESDRGLALVGADFLDSILASMLKAYFVDTRDIAERLLGSDRPLSTFSSRIVASYLIGLIPRSYYDDLERVRKIRNEFAHHYRALTFGHHKIKQVCEELAPYIEFKKLFKGKGIDGTDAPRQGYIYSVVVISNYLLGTCNSLQHIQEKDNTPLVIETISNSEDGRNGEEHSAV